MIFELLSVVAPVFVVALIGLAWVRAGAPFDERSISRLVLNVGIPCLVFRSVHGLPRKVLILQASMPVGVLNYLFAQRYGRSPENVASLVLVSTLISVLSIPILLAWM